MVRRPYTAIAPRTAASRARHSAGRALGVVAAAVALCAVAIGNGGPIVYPDSIAYMIDAERMSHFAAPHATRPVFYGLATWLLQWHGQYGLALFAQALIVSHLLSLTLRAFGARPKPGGFLLLTLGLVLLTPVAWHLAHLLPDIFVGVLILALFLLGFCSDTLGRGERVYLIVLATAAASFHLTAPPVGLVVFVVAGLWWLFLDRQRVRPLLVGLPLALAVLGSLAFSEIVWQRFTLTPNSPPHLLARILADGPGRDFLAARCPDADFVLCRYRDQLPATEDGFLWVMLPALPTADGKQIKAQAGAVIGGTIAMFPLQVAGHMLSNAGRQFVTIRSETQFSPAEWAAFEQNPSPFAQTVANTLQAHEWFDRTRLDMVNAFHLAVAATSLALAIGLLIVCARSRLGRPAALLSTVLATLVANAFLSGALGGVFGRYQGRVVWLLPFALVAAFLAWRRHSVTADAQIRRVDLRLAP